MNTTELALQIRPEKNSDPYGILTHDLCTRTAEVMGLNPERAWFLFELLVQKCSYLRGSTLYRRW